MSDKPKFTPIRIPVPRPGGPHSGRARPDVDDMQEQLEEAVRLHDAITRFRGEYEFLSNFRHAPRHYPVYGSRLVVVGSIILPTVEHAFQFNKAVGSVVDRIEACDMLAQKHWGVEFKYLTAGTAKKCGRFIDLRPDWETAKIHIMRGLLREKFRHDPEGGQLLATRDRHLEEGNDHHDTYWGTYKGRGENHLGKLLMEVRDELA